MGVVQAILASGWLLPALGLTYDSVYGTVTEDTLPYDVTPSSDGTKMYMCGYNSDKVYQYSMTAWDMSTLAYASKSYTVDYKASPSPHGMVLSAAGTTAILLDESRALYQSTLAVANDISTAAYASKTFSLASETANNTVSVAVNSDGTKIYVLSLDKYVYQYTLSSGWDLSTISYASKSLYVGMESAPYGLAFNSDGSKLYIMGGSKNIYQFTLSSPWDVSTGAPATQISVAATITYPTSMFINATDTKAYILGYTQKYVFQYSMS